MKLSYLIPSTDRHRALVKSLGLDTIQLRLGPGFPLTLDGPVDELQATADLLRSDGLAISSLGFYRNMLDPDGTLRDLEIARLRRLMAGAHHFGTSTISVFAGRQPELTIEENIPLFREVWGPLAAEAEALGLRFAFENCTMYRGYPIRGINMSISPAAYTLMFDAIPSRALGIEFDPSHCLKQCIDPLRFIRDFADRIYHVHAKDHERLPELEYLHGCFDVRASRDRLPGRGQVDFEAIIAELHMIGYKGAITIEGERDPDFPDGVEEGIRGAVEYLRKLMVK